jgi:hypothetical protein
MSRDNFRKLHKNFCDKYVISNSKDEPNLHIPENLSVKKIYITHVIENPELYIGTDFVSSGKCVYDETTFKYELQFFLNNPAIPFHKIYASPVEIYKSDERKWPTFTYDGITSSTYDSHAFKMVELQTLNSEWKHLRMTDGVCGVHSGHVSSYDKHFLLSQE